MCGIISAQKIQQHISIKLTRLCDITNEHWVLWAGSLNSWAQLVSDRISTTGGKKAPLLIWGSVMTVWQMKNKQKKSKPVACSQWFDSGATCEADDVVVATIAGHSDRLGPADVSSDSWALMACFTLALFSVKCTITENNLIASNKCPVFIPFKEHLAFPLKRRSLIRRWLSGSRTWGSWKRWGNTGSLSGKGTEWHWGGS